MPTKRLRIYRKPTWSKGPFPALTTARLPSSQAKNVLGWRDKTEHEMTGKDGAPLAMPAVQISFVTPNGNSDSIGE